MTLLQKIGCDDVIFSPKRERARRTMMIQNAMSDRITLKGMEIWIDYIEFPVCFMMRVQKALVTAMLLMRLFQGGQEDLQRVVFEMAC
jgi:hypothetical protein